MSEVVLYALNKNGQVEEYDGVRNSWAGAMHVWNTLSNKYATEGSLYGGYNETWSNFNRNFYKEYEDIVLGSTFDNVLVKKDNFDKLINAFKTYATNHVGSNYEEQITILQRMKEDEDVMAVGWQQTTVSESLWEFDYDEEADEMIPYDINKGTKHWYLFEEMENAE